MIKAGVNDYTDLTPQQIADVIEAQYRKNEFSPYVEG